MANHKPGGPACRDKWRPAESPRGILGIAGFQRGVPSGKTALNENTYPCPHRCGGCCRWSRRIPLRAGLADSTRAAGHFHEDPRSGRGAHDHQCCQLSRRRRECLHHPPVRLVLSHRKHQRRLGPERDSGGSRSRDDRLERLHRRRRRRKSDRDHHERHAPRDTHRQWPPRRLAQRRHPPGRGGLGGQRRDRSQFRQRHRARPAGQHSDPALRGPRHQRGLRR